MDLPKPDPVDPPPARASSLADRIGAAWRGGLPAVSARLARPMPPRVASRAEWIGAGMLALLLAAGPLATLLLANRLTARAEAATAVLRERVEPRRAAEAARLRARAELAAMLARPGPSATVEALARALPEDAVLRRVARGGDGALAVEVFTPDPDRLRTALRRAPELAGLRETGQAGDESGLRVRFEERGE